MILVIDNYDSFTYNLVQYLGELGAEPWVFRNDRVTLGELASMRPSHIVISPGPGDPRSDAGISNQVIQRFHGRVPILGVCLGHQCIGHVFGAQVGRAPSLMHGKVSRISHGGGRLFAGIPRTFQATRYHSLAVQDPLPPALTELARSCDGAEHGDVLMALRHRQAPTFGVQFHPESILTPHGKQLLRNFLRMGAGDEPDGDGAADGGSALSMPEAIERALDGQGFSAAEAQGVMERIMAGEATPVQIAAFLAALRAKGESVEEITGFARAMRARASAVRPGRRPLLDTCGTGGDRAGTFNISTVAALVVAGAGVAVAKHGNRSVSSRCGSADLLQAMGVRLDLPPERVAQCIDEVGFGFLFAPALHPAMKHAVVPRREMGVRTVFNILGPLSNPAAATAQVLGVYSPALVETMSRVLQELGTESAFVVHNAQGLDELSTAGRNLVVRLHQGALFPSEVDGATLRLQPATADSLRGGDAAENAEIARRILSGEQGPRRDVVLLNAGLGLVAAGAAADLAEGVARPAESLDGGRAKQVLENLVAFTQAAAVASEVAAQPEQGR